MEQKSSSNHIDKNVILILLGTIIVAATTVVIKIFNSDPCEIVDFGVEANQYRVGEIIRFKDFSDNVTERQWSFGDSTELRYTENPFHTYANPGTYKVELVVNGKCTLEQEIVINKKVSIIDSTKIAQFKIPNTIKVGDLLQAKDLTLKATSWEWRFGETSEVNSTFQNPTYSYLTEGLKTVTLIVNGDPRYSSQKKITVLPKTGKTTKMSKREERRTLRQEKRDRESIIKYDPTINNAPPASVKQEPKEVKPEIKQISRTAFAKKVIKVSKKEATANDFKPYLCDNLQVTTMAKGKKTTFLEFCEDIKGKKIKIKSLELFKNEKNKCIEYISIDYSKSIF